MKHMALTLVIATSPVWADSPVAPVSASAESYRSAFNNYKPMQDEALLDWRQANNEMGRLRGHMGHLDAKPVEPELSHQHSGRKIEAALSERR